MTSVASVLTSRGSRSGPRRPADFAKLERSNPRKSIRRVSARLDLVDHLVRGEVGNRRRQIAEQLARRPGAPQWRSRAPSPRSPPVSKGAYREPTGPLVAADLPSLGGHAPGAARAPARHAQGSGHALGICTPSMKGETHGSGMPSDWSGVADCPRTPTHIATRPLWALLAWPSRKWTSRRSRRSHPCADDQNTPDGVAGRTPGSTRGQRRPCCRR